MEKKNLVLFLILAIAALFVIENFSGKDVITGRTADMGVKSCSDSDSLDIFTKGTVATDVGGLIKEYNDRCSGGGGVRVLENYCDGDRRAFTYKWCPNEMVCNDGRCVGAGVSSYY